MQDRLSAKSSIRSVTVFQTCHIVVFVLFNAFTQHKTSKKFVILLYWNKMEKERIV